jgi:hypothetical protein
VEIDLTPEVSGRRSSPTRDKYRHRIIVVAALMIGLVAGGLVGVAFGQKSAGRGAVVFTGADLVEANRVVMLHWRLANFSTSAARVNSVRVDGGPAAIGSPSVAGKAVAEFTTPLRCGDTGPPQFSIVVIDGDGQKQELGYLVDQAEWRRLCK